MGGNRNPGEAASTGLPDATADGVVAAGYPDLADIPGLPVGGSVSVPGTTIKVPAIGRPGGTPLVTPPVYSAARVVAKDSVRYVLRSAPAWRTAKYWGTVIGLLMLAVAALYVFRRSRPVAPVVTALDRFARQFIRG